ncbi:MAG: hypothetical protein Q8P05_05300 [Candidatus Diapherotrites archaeon]|nr:hypothetical protein [Candidatus Diapherotrites archaeon]MDZ4256937.1 hypothetical protein [archaeon]
MAIGTLFVSVGLFLMSLIVAVYLIRYSNQQITRCLHGLQDKHNELVDLNTHLARQILETDKRLRQSLHQVKHAK